MQAEQMQGGMLKVTFPYHPYTLDIIKKIPGRQYNPDGVFWTVPGTKQNLMLLMKQGFKIPEHLEDHLKITKPKQLPLWQRIPIIEDYPNINEEIMDGIPGRPPEENPWLYQKIGVSFIQHLNGRALVADGMRLGKTIQALGWCSLRDDCFPALIICESIAKINWEREIKHVLKGDYSCVVLKGTKPHKIPKKHFIIINYHILHKWQEELKEAGVKCVIIDECQNVKNSQTLKTKAVKYACRKKPFIIGLSGTPIKSRPSEFYNAIKLIDNQLFPNHYEYLNYFCGGLGVANGASNTQELHDILTSTIMIRRTKEDVWKHLPALRREVIPIEIDNKGEYNRAKSDFIEWVMENHGMDKAMRASNAEALVKINYLRSIALKGKMKQACEWIENFMDDSDEKLAIFFAHTEPLLTLEQKYKKICVTVHGQTASNQRMANVDKFRYDPNCRLFLGNIQSAGTSISLRPCWNIAFFESGWTPGDNDQVEDRCSAFDQTSRVYATYLVAQGTIEQDIIKLIDKKRKILTAILDGKEVTQESMLSEILKQYTIKGGIK